METILKICDLVDTSDTSDISAQLISVKSEQDISKCLQLIVATGFLPYLHPSVGIPIQKRSQFYQLLNSHPSQLNDEQVQSFHIHSKYFMLQFFLIFRNILDWQQHLKLFVK